MFLHRLVSPHRKTRFLLFLFIAAVFSFSFIFPTNAHADLDAPCAITSEYQEVLLSVTLNQQDTQQVILFLQNAKGQLLASETDLQQWNFCLPKNSHAILYQQKNYYLLDNFPGVTYQVDTHNMAVMINVPASLFKSQTIKENNALNLAIPRTTPGGFFNYDASLTTATEESQTGSILEAGFFNPWGVGVADFLAQRVTNCGNGNTNQFTRLQSTWTYDDPQHMRSLRLGDAFSQSGMWGQSGVLAVFNLARILRPNRVLLPFHCRVYPARPSCLRPLIYTLTIL